MVLIAASDVLPAFTARAAITDSEVLAFSDADVLRALEAITVRKPRLVALERLFAATPRGAALINRIKADPSLLQTEIRVLAHDSDYSRVLPRTGTLSAPASPSRPAENLVPDKSEPAAPAATLEPHPNRAIDPVRMPLDQKGTRRAPRFTMADKVDILIDGNPATLLDLSTCGAQVISPTILKPNQRVRMALPEDAGMLRFNATIMWASFELPPGVGPRYRAGIDFVDADAALVDAFCVRHRA